LRRRRPSAWLIGVILLFLLQLVCALVFILDILSSVVGVLPLPQGWQGREMIEIGAALGLLLGLMLGTGLLIRAVRQRNLARDGLRRASGAFYDLMEERFREWGLTLAERDVSLFLIKGMSTAEIARLRDTSEGTVKSQTNAIYRKAAVVGRQQLLSLIIEDLMGDRPEHPALPQDDVLPVAPKAACRG
jgi:DNA-binding CsgD family transcriptional regulator